MGSWLREGHLVAMTRRYRLLGLELTSSFPFASHLLEAEGDADLCFEAEPARPDGVASPEPVYESPFLDGLDRPVLRIEREDGFERLRFPGVADFLVREGRISYTPFAPDRRDLVEVRFLGTVLAYYLERAGVPVLHASAVAVEG
ncbi:MAG: hypothetical protein KDD47_23410, partial [Acidobacteria bacterium]|nr:hypothetical protein [Acidobacteriota bacterium]